MPDDLPRKGPAAKGPSYDDDFYAWTQHQAAVLREMAVRDNRFDREHVAEELECLGREQRNAIRREILKLEFLPAGRERFGWMYDVTTSRNTIDDSMTPALRRLIETDLPHLYCQGRELAEVSLREAVGQAVIDKLSPTCPFTLDQILDEDWYPEPAEKQP